MRVAGYIPIFYGAEYLSECIKSMENHVEVIHIFYTPKPSQGYATDIPCPETEDELKAIAVGASSKVVWHTGIYGSEGEHRSEIYKFTTCTDGLLYDLVLTLDCDEVLEEQDIEQALKLAYESDKRYIGISGFINFWRSFSWACYDSFRPIRIINLRNPEGTQGEVNLRIYHFSCAQSRKITDFKWNVSGHRSELRKDWLGNTYYNWTPTVNCTDLHMTSIGLWNAVPFPKETLPEILKQHPNFNKELI